MKLNKKGFTLIELLAVITIMGILMVVAIPAVSRTIENSRRDTFGDVARNYINVVRTAVLADEIECYKASNGKPTDSAKNIASLPDGIYIYYIATSASVINETSATNGASATYFLNATMTAQNIVTATSDLLESGGKSSWGNSDVFGYVIWNKHSADTTTKYDYAIQLQDTGKHGLTGVTLEDNVKRSNISSTAITGDTAAKLTTPVQKTTIFNKGTETGEKNVDYICKLA